MVEYYYNTLCDVDKYCYKVVRDNLLNKIFEFNTPVFRDLSALTYAISKDYPELYYVDFDDVYYHTGDQYWIKFGSHNYNTMLFDRKLNEIVNKGKIYRTDYDKVKFIHDYFAYNVKYDYQSLEEINIYNAQLKNTGNPNKLDHAISDVNAYGSIVENSSVCQGIALAAVLILRKLGVDAFYMSGISKDNTSLFPKDSPHAWFMAWIDGNLYHVDITSDLYIDSFETISYAFLNVNDKMMSKIFRYDCMYEAFCLDNNYYYKNKKICNNDNDIIKLFRTINYNVEKQTISFLYRGFKKEEHIMQLFLSVYNDLCKDACEYSCLKIMNVVYFTIRKK